MPINRGFKVSLFIVLFYAEPAVTTKGGVTQCSRHKAARDDSSFENTPGPSLLDGELPLLGDFELDLHCEPVVFRISIETAESTMYACQSLTQFIKVLLAQQRHFVTASIGPAHDLVAIVRVPA